MKTRILGALLLIFIASLGHQAKAHPGHDHGTPARVWRDVSGAELMRGDFALLREGKVGVYRPDSTMAWIDYATLAPTDRQWVDSQVERIRRLNSTDGVSFPTLETVDFDGWPALLVLLAFGGTLLCVIRAREKLRFMPYAGAAACLGLVALVAVGVEQQKASNARKHFEPFGEKVKLREDERFLYVESNGIPDHQMMVGIRAWQQQVPIPQPYTGENAWRIPLFPKKAANPVSAKTALFRGAIALAVNGVPIFNPIKNDGRTDTLIAGELDNFGGHCGRGDDYHYHIGPVHLEKVTGKGNPIGYGLDGYPLLGYADASGNEPKNLDAFNGREEADGYKYYSTRRYPYINGGMRGEVTVREDQVDPQPRASGSVRPALPPLRGAKIIDFDREDDKKTYTLSYSLPDGTHRVRYNRNADGGWTFRFIEPNGKESVSTYQSRGPGGRGGPGGGGGGRGPGGPGGGGRRPMGDGKGDRPRGPGGPGGAGDNRPGGPPMGDPGRQPWFAAHFDELDTDKDGVITTAEVKKEVEKTFNGFDTDKNGKLTREEYQGKGPGSRSALAGFVKGHNEEFAEKDGTITKAGLEGFMLKMFEKADRKKAGKITRAEAAQTGPGQRRPRD
jgi:hypothetical protein